MHKFFVTCLLLTLVVLTGCQKGKSIEGKWEGALTLPMGQMRTRIDLTRQSDGKYKGTLTSLDENGVSVPLEEVTLDGEQVRMTLKQASKPGNFEGKLNAEGNEMTGKWTQAGVTLDLTLKRASETKP